MKRDRQPAVATSSHAVFACELLEVLFALHRVGELAEGLAGSRAGVGVRIDDGASGAEERLLERANRTSVAESDVSAMLTRTASHLRRLGGPAR